MCHILLLMPVLGLGAFWIWPIEIAGPVYAVILLLSVILYVIVMQTLHSPVKTGIEGLRHEVGEVVQGGKRDCRVQVHDELWKALASDPVVPGERIEVTGSKGLVLRVQPYTNEKKGVSSYAKR